VCSSHPDCLRASVISPIRLRINNGLFMWFIVVPKLPASTHASGGDFMIGSLSFARRCSLSFLSMALSLTSFRYAASSYLFNCQQS
jgi:hypothetical protein